MSPEFSHFAVVKICNQVTFSWKPFLASSISISFHFRRTPRTWTGNLYKRQEHSWAVWANSQLLFWFDCLHNKNIKTLRICPHCLAVSLAFVHYFVWVRGVRWKWNEIELDHAKYGDISSPLELPKSWKKLFQNPSWYLLPSWFALCPNTWTYLPP